MNRLRLRIGLRLLLLLVALACVLSAYLRASLDLRRERIREELIGLDTRERLLTLMPNRAQNPAAELAKVKSEIAEKKRKIVD
jgi:hypothetical protein